MDSGVGITPENNGEIVRLGIPQPTGERRKELVKQCNKIAERAKIEVRNVRQEVKEKLKKAIKDGLSEDLEKDAENDLQKLHDKYIKQLEGLMDEKEKDAVYIENDFFHDWFLRGNRMCGAFSFILPYLENGKKGLRVARGACRPLMICERGSAGSIGSTGMVRRIKIGKCRGVLIALRTAVIESVTLDLSCTPVSIT